MGWAAVVAVTSAVGGAAAAQCPPSDINGDGVVDGADLGVLLTEWGETCPAFGIGSILPASGPLAGGIPIAIKGVGLDGVISVTIGGVPAPSVVGVDSTTIVALLPPSKTPGPRDVVVVAAAGTATLPDGFTYSLLPWATVLEESPDPKIIVNDSLRAAIVATGLPWRVRDNASQIEMLLVPPGTFMMGCSPSLQWGCASFENPVHQVTLTQPFYLGRYEVTQAQWTAVMGSNPSLFKNSSAQVPASQVPNRPVERVSWNMIQSFNAATGLRLPNEAEWEYACRAGTTTAFNNGSNDGVTLGAIAWTSANAGEQTRPVGQKMANALGLHDMHGNVFEWVNDWYSGTYYSQSPEIDPPGPINGSGRVLRGGSWADGSNECRASSRYAENPDSNAIRFGFRAARTP